MRLGNTLFNIVIISYALMKLDETGMLLAGHTRSTVITWVGQTSTKDQLRFKNPTHNVINDKVMKHNIGSAYQPTEVWLKAFKTRAIWPNTSQQCGPMHINPELWLSTSQSLYPDDFDLYLRLCFIWSGLIYVIPWP